MIVIYLSAHIHLTIDERTQLKMTRPNFNKILDAAGRCLEGKTGVPVHRFDLQNKAIDPRTAENFFRMFQY
ncbi:MAG: hypothetical protein EAX81_07405 [Candidatus Thorarchaeota archaeon]|nr:hypothetical protein [Candidatus Thorarchaeota archaeon]